MSPGDHVEATQVVARANLLGDLMVLHVARRLNVRASRGRKALQVELGDTVQRGEVVGKAGGILGRSVKSPINGVVTAEVGGTILIEDQPVPFELRGYIPGRVLEVTDNQRVIIEATGALVEGAWGSGGESVGTLKVMTREPQEALSAQSLDPSCHGTILVAGMTLDKEVLEQAENVEARGIITGGLSGDLIPITEQLPFPVIVTEGIGDITMASPIFDLLRVNDGEEASVNGRVEPRYRNSRPEVIIPKSGRVLQRDKQGEGESLEVGMRVRIVRAPLAGSVGTIVDLPRYARPIETGARVRTAQVDIGRDEPVIVPLVNLDVLR